MLSFLRRTPWWPLALMAVVIIVGGPLNSVDARGVIVSDDNGLPVAPRDVFVGARHYAVGDDGRYNAPNLPRGAKITVVAQGYARVDAPADQTEIRLVTAITTYNVADADTGAPIPTPEARVGTKVIGRGTDTGIMVVAPAPPKETQIMICAAGYTPAFTNTSIPTVGIRLKKGGDGCPLLPGQTPAPSPSPSAAPSPSASPRPS